MEAKINLSDQVKDPEIIKELVSKLVTMVNVNQIYMSPGEKEHAFSYRFTIIVEDMAKRFKERVREVLNDLFEKHPSFYVRFFTLHQVVHETTIGNTFFLNNCSEETLIYYHNKYDKAWLFQKVDLSAVIETANQNFLMEKQKIISFKKGASLFLEENNYALAAFMLHQTIELSFTTLERFLVGVSFTEHTISGHQAYLGQVIKELGKVFPKKNEKQIQLLNKLNTAYVKSRYALDYNIGNKQVHKINEKADELICKLTSYFESEILKCETSLEKHYHNATKEDLPISTEKENNIDDIDDIDDMEQTTLEKIKELSKQNFKTLTPIGGIQEGYYLNYARVYDYMELFCTLKSTLNVCILALDEELDYTLDIRHKESDVKAVLEFAKNLIPMEESNYLDEMRKLILSNDEDTLYPKKKKHTN